MRKILKKILIGFLALIVILVLALFIYSRNPYTALEEMDDAIALVEDSSVTYYEDRDEIRYSVDNPTKNIVFIPGGLVTPDSYNYLAISLALEGYDVVIAKAPFDLAILNPFIGKEFLSETLDNVVIGHSLGGVTASMVFAGNDLIESMIFLGSYPVKDVSAMNTLFITAEFDLGMDPEALEDSYQYTNSSNTIINIEGGNHAQFGWYGPQEGDGTAELDTITQQNLVRDYILDFIQ